MSSPIYITAPLAKTVKGPGPEFPIAVKVSELVFALQGNWPVRDILVQQIYEATKEPDNRTHAETAISCAGALAGAAALYRASLSDLTSLGELAEQKEALARVGFNSSIRALIKYKILIDFDFGRLSISRIVNGGALYAGSETICEGGSFMPPAKGQHLVGERIPLEGTVHAPHESPRAAVARCWPQTKRFLEAANSQLDRWPLEIAAAAQVIIIRCKSVLAPNISANIAMQSAIVGAFLDPTEVGLPERG
jgi:hypothetical protein